MFNKIFTILKIKKLKKDNVDNQFLVNFKNELAGYMVDNPALKKESGYNKGEINIFTYFNKLNFKHMPVIIIALIALITTGGGVAAASQTSLPNDALYPVKILTEEVRENLSFDNSAKARLHAEYAAKRVEEVQKMLDEKGVDAKGLEIAIANLMEHTSQSANIVNEERSKGKNVSDLAKEVQSKIEKVKVDLENELNEAEEKSQKDEDKKMLKDKAEKVKTEVEEDEDQIGKSEEFKQEAEAAMLEAQKAFADISQQMASSTASSTEFARYNEFMDKANIAFSKEHWVQARQHAIQAVKALDKDVKKINKEEQGKAVSEIKKNEEVGGKNEDKKVVNNKDVKSGEENGDRQDSDEKTVNENEDSD